MLVTSGRVMSRVVVGTGGVGVEIRVVVGTGRVVVGTGRVVVGTGRVVVETRRAVRGLKSRRVAVPVVVRRAVLLAGVRGAEQVPGVTVIFENEVEGYGQGVQPNARRGDDAQQERPSARAVDSRVAGVRHDLDSVGSTYEGPAAG